jgi:hypothetical protein
VAVRDSLCRGVGLHSLRCCRTRHASVMPPVPACAHHCSGTTPTLSTAPPSLLPRTCVQEQKYLAGQFGFCPRVHCDRQAVLPVGLSDDCGMDSVKVFCPLCQEVFRPMFDNASSVDGAYFGTTFPHLFFLSKPHLVPRGPLKRYVPKVFGFKLFHPSHLRAGSKEGLEPAVGAVAAAPEVSPTLPPAAGAAGAGPVLDAGVLRVATGARF